MRNRLTLGLAALLLVAASASALAPTTVSYQGSLKDALGDPVNAVVALQFTVYNDAVLGGAANIKWTETHAAVTVTDGLFSVTLGSINPLFDSVFNQPDRWLGIKVGADPEITPRTKFTSVAYSDRTHTIDGAAGGTISGIVNIHHNLNVGEPTVAGNLSVMSATTGFPGVRLFEATDNPRMWVYGEDGDLSVQADGDIDGSGGFFRVYSGNVSGNSFTIDGNADGTNSPVVTIDGSGAVIIFDPDTVGNTSVELPVSALSDAEILDEPGVAHINTTGIVLPTGADTDITSRSITCPTDGYVLVIGSAEVSAAHVFGTQTSGWFGVSKNSGNLPNEQDVDVVIPATAPTGAYDTPFSSHGVFSVSAGINTFYLSGHEFSGDFTIHDINLSLLFVPTAYGSVSIPAPPGPGANNDNTAALTATRGPLTQAEIDSEKREAEAFDRARVQAELDDMQAQIDRLRAKLRDNDSKQTPTASQR